MYQYILLGLQFEFSPNKEKGRVEGLVINSELLAFSCTEEVLLRQHRPSGNYLKDCSIDSVK